MKILFVNSVCGTGSTGRICGEVAEYLSQQGWECRIAYGRQTNMPERFQKFAMPIGSRKDLMIHGLSTRLLDDHGFRSRFATKKWLEEVKAFDPDVIHLHNLHGYYLNLPLLFEYLKENGKPVLWTLHDCWSYTGHCAYYSFAGCDKWKTGCHHCPQKGSYPGSLLLDGSKRNYKQKKELFTSLAHLSLATPSRWLAEQVKMSYLKKYSVHVVTNGVDLSRFKPTPSALRGRYGLENKKVILGVASVWDRRKGLETFLKMANMLGEDYQVVLIGLTGKQIQNLPSNVLGLPRTNSVEELAAWYSLADVYVNASTEETMGMTTVEAAACGTPSVVLDATALPEIARELNGIIVPAGDLSALCEAAELGCQRKETTVIPDLSQFYTQAMAEKYRHLYESILRKV